MLIYKRKVVIIGTDIYNGGKFENKFSNSVFVVLFADSKIAANFEERKTALRCKAWS